MLVDPLSDSRGLLDTTSPFFMAGPAHISVSMVMVFTSVFSLVFFLCGLCLCHTHGQLLVLICICLTLHINPPRMAFPELWGMGQMSSPGVPLEPRTCLHPTGALHTLRLMIYFGAFHLSCDLLLANPAHSLFGTS